jgi:hypothetical protein
MRGATLLVLGALLGAQELVFQAPRIDEIHEGGPGVLIVRAGRELWRFEDSGGTLKAPGLAPWHVLAEGTLLYDAGARVLEADSDEVRSGRNVRAGPAVLDPGPGARPRRVPWLLADGGFVLAAGDGAAWHPPEGPPRPLLYAPLGRARVGWGLGDPVRLEVALPFLRARRSGTGELELLVIVGDRILHHAGAEAPRDLGFPPMDDEEGFLGVDHEVAPFVADLLPEPGQELVVVDVSAGRAHLIAPGSHPPWVRTIGVGGAILAARALDVDGDGFEDLALLRTPRATLAAQFRVLAGRRLPVEFLIHRGGAKGLERSPAWSIRLELPVELEIDDERRRARFPAALLLARGPRVLLAEPTGALSWYAPEGSPGPLRRLPAGHSPAPFGGPGIGGGALLLWWRGADHDQLWRVPCPP